MNRVATFVAKRWAKGREGFALAEALAALGVMAMVGALLMNTLYQMNLLASRGSAQLAVGADLRTSVQWLAKDIRSGKTTDLVDGGPPVSCAAVAPSPCMTLDWTDEYQGASIGHSSSYALVGTELRRTYDGATQAVARNVAEIEVSLQGKLVTVTLTSTSGAWSDVSEQLTHYFYLRSL